MPTFSKEITQKQQEQLNLYHKAQDGDQSTLDFFLKEHQCKIYTNEEIKVLNQLLKRRCYMEKEIITIQEDKVIDLPNLAGIDHPARINWIEDIGNGHFRAGLTYLNGYPYQGGSTEWVLKLDPEMGFKPLFCSLYWQGDC